MSGARRAILGCQAPGMAAGGSLPLVAPLLKRNTYGTLRNRL